MKNLLDILTREKKLIERISTIKGRINSVQIEIAKLPKATELKRLHECLDDLYVCKGIVDEELEICRSEIREYFEELFKKGDP